MSELRLVCRAGPVACVLFVAASVGCLDEQQLHPPVPNPYGMDGRAAVIAFLQENGVKGRYHELTDQQVVDAYMGFIERSRPPVEHPPILDPARPTEQTKGPRANDSGMIDTIRLQLKREFGISLPQGIQEVEARHILDEQIKARRDGRSVPSGEGDASRTDKTATGQVSDGVQVQLDKVSQADLLWAEVRPKIIRESPWKGMDDAQVRAAAVGQHDWDMKERLGWPTDNERIHVGGIEGERWTYRDHDKFGQISRVMRVVFVQRVCTEVVFGP